MLVPIILFLLGLPNRGPRAADHDDVEGRTAALVKDASESVGLVSLEPWSRLAYLGKSAGDNEFGEALPVDFSRLIKSADDRVERSHYQGKTVKVLGQFVPDPRDPRFFALVRFSINCCAADAVGKPIAVFAREPITSIKRDGWAEVIGKVEYGKRGDGYVTRLVTAGPTTVRPSNPDVNPYIQ